MKIALLCNILKPGVGLGDGTRRLAGALVRQGHASVIVALNDPHVSETTFETQEIEGVALSVLRLPAEMPWPRRAVAARNWLAAFNPDWVSLQFVIFGFHPKGLCFGLGKTLATINSNAPWNVMFHELWLGLGEQSSGKHRIWGGLQRIIIRDLLKRLRPRVVHTQADPYRIALGREGIEASILPLFSNIPRIPGDGGDDLLEPLIAESIGSRVGRDRLYLAGVFGEVHPEWSAEKTVNTVLPLVQRGQQRLVLVFLGKNNLSPAAVKNLKLTLQNRADLVMAGERPSAEISKILQALDLGLATTPRQMIQKSGSVVAMLDHGLQVLVTRDDWRLRGWEAPLEHASPRLLSPAQFAGLKTLPVRDPQLTGDNSVHRIAGQMLASLAQDPA